MAITTVSVSSIFSASPATSLSPERDGIDDTPYDILGDNHQDRYPIIREWDEPEAEIRTVIYPVADVYAFGKFETGYSRSQLKFDISSIPPESKVLSAKLWLHRFAADNWDGKILLNRVDDQLWGENITASEFDSQTLTNEETRASKFMSPGWDYLGVENQLNADHEAGHTYSNFRLRCANDNGVEPSVGIDDGRFLVIESELDELFIIFSSSEYNGSSPYLEVIYLTPHEWNLIEIWTATIESFAEWQIMESWSGTVSAPAEWDLIDTWAVTVSAPAAWQLIEVWTGTVEAPAYPRKPILYLPSNGSAISDKTPYFEWTRGENADYHRLLVDNDPDFSSPEENRVVLDNNYTVADENSLPRDHYSWKVIAINAQGESESSIWTFLIGPAAPKLVSPENNAAERDLTRTFTWTEPEVGVTYRIQIDEEASFTYPYVHENAAVIDNSYSYTFSTDGTYYWRVSAIDAANNEGPFADSCNFTIDTQAPTSSVDPISPYWRTSVPFAITVTASDATSGVASVRLFYRYSTDKAAWGAWTSFGVDTAGPWSFSFTAPSGDGYYEFYSTAADVSTNTESAPAPADAIAGVDTVPPTGSVTINAGATYTTSTSVTLALTHADATSGVSQVRYSNDGIWDTEPWEGPFAIRAWNLSDGDGTKTVYYQIKDGAGLVSAAYSDTIILDTTPPDAPALVSPSNGAISIDNKPTFDWADVTGVVEYQLQADNDPDFSSPEIHVTVSASTYTSTVELPDGNYSWRVLARDAANNLSDWSAVWTFFVGVGDRVVGVLIPLAISAFLIGAAVLSPAYFLRVRSQKAARRRVLRDVSLASGY